MLDWYKYRVPVYRFDSTETCVLSNMMVCNVNISKLFSNQIRTDNANLFWSLSDNSLIVCGFFLWCYFMTCCHGSNSLFRVNSKVHEKLFVIRAGLQCWMHNCEELKRHFVQPLFSNDGFRNTGLFRHVLRHPNDSNSCLLSVITGQCGIAL